MSDQFNDDATQNVGDQESPSRVWVTPSFTRIDVAQVTKYKFNADVADVGSAPP